MMRLTLVAAASLPTFALPVCAQESDRTNEVLKLAHKYEVENPVK